MRRHLFKAIALLVIPLGWVAVQSYRAASQFTIVQLAVVSDPVLALKKTLEAVDTYPLERHYRYQTVFSLRAAMQNPKVEVSRQAFDQAYKNSRNASPKSPAVMMARVEYLINGGDGNDTAEIEELLTDLKRYGFLYSGTWFAEAVWAGRLGDVKRLALAVDRGLRSPHMGPGHRAEFVKWAEAIGQEYGDGKI